MLDSGWSQPCSSRSEMEMNMNANRVRLAGIIVGIYGTLTQASVRAEVSRENGTVAGHWVTARWGSIPTGSLKAGSAAGADLYICRGYHHGGTSSRPDCEWRKEVCLCLE